MQLCLVALQWVHWVLAQVAYSLHHCFIYNLPYFPLVYSDINIHHVTYNNIYTENVNQMSMFKSYGGSSSVYDITLQNFIGHKNAYSLCLSSYWASQTEAPGNGVLYHDITFNNWKGTCSDGMGRGPIRIICPDGAPYYNIVLENVDTWTETGSVEVH
jgi:rhamnogalacturonan hydrolase